MMMGVDDMKALLDHARVIGTTDRWADLAVEFIQAQDDEIKSLNDRIKELGG